MAHTINILLSSLTVVAQLMVVVLVIVYYRDRNKPTAFFHFVSNKGMLLAFIVSLIAMLGSLTYSDILHYEPCKFCWFQRIFMYPQVFLLGIALWKKDQSVIKYSLTLSIIGALIAANHYLLQMTGTSVLPCSTVGQSVSCNKVFVLHFGYITIPLMALSAFLLIIISMMFARKRNA
jgi:disulfide bond formation protein DsbB